MRILYFAWLRTNVGTAEEEVSPPPGTRTVSDLIAWLKTRGEGYTAALSDLRAVRVAINQEFAQFEDPVEPDDEVAFFPPMTGG